MPNKSRGALPTTTEHRLGWQHQQQRSKLFVRHPDGKRCWWCGRPMWKKAEKNWDGKPLHADHERSRSKFKRSIANRLLHDTCNKQRGDGSRDHLRPALAQKPDETTQLYPLLMGWP